MQIVRLGSERAQARQGAGLRGRLAEPHRGGVRAAFVWRFRNSSRAGPGLLVGTAPRVVHDADRGANRRAHHRPAVRRSGFSPDAERCIPRAAGRWRRKRGLCFVRGADRSLEAGRNGSTSSCSDKGTARSRWEARRCRTIVAAPGGRRGAILRGSAGGDRADGATRIHRRAGRPAFGRRPSARRPRISRILTTCCVATHQEPDQHSVLRRSPEARIPCPTYRDSGFPQRVASF